MQEDKHVNEPSQDEDVIMAHGNVATAEDGAEIDKKQDVVVVSPQPMEAEKMQKGQRWGRTLGKGQVAPKLA